jgi:hypothetical protein
MKSQAGTGAESTMLTDMLTEQDNEWVRRRRDELQKEAAVFEAQLTALEQEYACSTILLKMLGRAFGFGAAGKLERARFKVSYKREQLAEFESLHLDGLQER